jgi:MFS family permease
MSSADVERVDAAEAISVTGAPDDEKKSHQIKDEAGDLAVLAISAGQVDPVSSKRVLKKIDLHILPFLCITYALQFIDKTSLAYSSVYGIIKDNNLQGSQFSWAASIFYFGYLLAEYPGVVLLQKFSVSRFLGVNIILWGGVLMTTAACSSFAGLATVRFILGMTEATISPGFVSVTGIWWSRTEQAGRSGLWISFLGVGGCVGGLLAYAIGHISGSLPPWKYIFVILGAVTVVWGVVFLLFVPDGPATAKWLNDEDKVVAVQRVAQNQTGTGRSRKWDNEQLKEAFADPTVIILGLISFVNAIGSGGLTFGPLIVQGLGFSPINTILVQLPLSVVQTVAQLGSGFLSSKVAGSRLHIGSIAMIPAVR